MEQFPAHLISENPVVHLLTPTFVVCTSLVVELYFSMWASFTTKSIVLVMEPYFAGLHSWLVMDTFMSTQQPQLDFTFQSNLRQTYKAKHGWVRGG